MISLKETKKDFKKNKEVFLLTLPGMLFIFIFSYLPMFGIIVAFQDFRYDLGFFNSKLVGLENFKFLFSNKDQITRLLRNTIGWNFIFITATLVVSVTLALLLNEVKKKYVKLYQTVLFFPYFISWVIAAYLLQALLDMDLGFVNNVLKGFGLEAVKWYLEPKHWPGILSLSYMWKFAGYYTIIYFAALISIDPEYYEAAIMDGASKWQQIKSITIPSIMPIIKIMLLLQISRICYSDFGMFYQLTQDSSLLYPTTDVIDTYVYRALSKTGDISMAAAAGLFQSIVGFILVLVSNYISNHNSEDKSII